MCRSVLAISLIAVSVFVSSAQVYATPSFTGGVIFSSMDQDDGDETVGGSTVVVDEE